MPGAEVLDGVSAVITSTEACLDIYNGAKTEYGPPPPPFAVVASGLPLLIDTLRPYENHLRKSRPSLSAEVYSTFEKLLQVCNERARTLQSIFERVIASGPDGWEQRYADLIRHLGTSKIEDLMIAMVQDIQTLISHKAVHFASAKQNQKLEKLLFDLEQLDSSINHVNTATVTNGDFRASHNNQNNAIHVNHTNNHNNMGDGFQISYHTVTAAQHFHSGKK